MRDCGRYYSRYGDDSRRGRFFCGALCCGKRPRISADHREKRNNDNIHRNRKHPHNDIHYTADIGFCGQQQYDRDKHLACFCIGNDLADRAANDLIFGDNAHDSADEINEHNNNYADNRFFGQQRLGDCDHNDCHEADGDNGFDRIECDNIVNRKVCYDNRIDIAFCGDDFDNRIYHTDHIVRLDEYNRRNDRDDISGYAAG